MTGCVWLHDTKLTSAQRGDECEAIICNSHAFTRMQDDVVFTAFLGQPEGAAQTNHAGSFRLLKQDHAVAWKTEAGWSEIDSHGTLLNAGLDIPWDHGLMLLCIALAW